ncbi:M20 family metallopeptidase [Bacillus sp. es.034]|uniref:M20 family metallopeptidase n=1 Tax=Bacillus sp. es.034 TaxID=1761763 RepID=UPI000C01B7A3|nr:M20 family metallopeptidase [Bacillus sp. es.034]PFG04514.1 glutamate carboxypeptidase [Bacillus sp. es.034]
MEEVVQFIKDKEAEMVDLLKQIVEHETPTANKELTDKLGAWIAEQFTRLTGGRTETIVNEQYGNHIRAEWGEGEEQILFLAHFDTVWPEGTIQEKPFRIVDGKAFGPGVFDMKGGIIQGLFAVHALHSLGKKLNKRVVFLFNSDEELGSPTSQELIEKEAARSERVFVLEPAMSTEGALKTSRKGVGIFQLKVDGKPAHSGIDPEKGVSAIGEIASQISYLHSLTDLSIGTTVNVGTVNGGTSSNVIAATAVAEIDLRVKAQEEFERVIPMIENLEPQDERTSLVVTGGINRPPLERTEEVRKMFQNAKSLAEQYLGFELKEKETGGGSDGNFSAQLAPTLDGLGAVGDGAHANHEHLIVKEMPVRSALVALLLLEFGK